MSIWNLFGKRPPRQTQSPPREPEDFDTGLARARALIESGRAGDAALAFEALLANHGQRVEALFPLGLAYDEMARAEDAFRAFLQVLEIAPDHMGALCCGALSARTLGDTDRAHALLEQALRVDPDSSHARFNLGLVRLDQGQIALAAADFAAARALVRGEPWSGTPPEQHLPSSRPDPADPDNGCARFKLVHDIEQLEYLQRLGRLGADYDRVLEDYRRALADPALPESPYERTALDPDRYPLLTATWKRPVHAPDPEPPAGAVVSPDLPWNEIEARYLAAQPNLAWIDGLLTPAGLSALRAWCLESTIWNDLKVGYLGAYMHDGFASRLMLRVAEELRERMPRVIGDLPLQTMWAYKYDPRHAGIGLHADEAKVNVNFWITPDEANLDPDSGGLVVYTHDAPPDWGFRQFNSDPGSIQRYLESVGSGAVRVPYRTNRAVLFDSDLFHETDRFQFRPGYENRRINVTLLYGHRR